MAVILRYLVIALTVFWMVRFILKWLQALMNSSQFNKKYDSNPFEQGKNHSIDPYQILGVSKNATSEEIKRAYRTALSQYHPDKVEHLGDDIKKVAKEKTDQIQRAYKEIG